MLVAAGATACSGNDGTESDAGNRNCNGALDSSAAKAVTHLVGSDSFLTSSPNGGAADVAKEIVSEYRNRGINSANDKGLCWIYGSEKDLSDLTITFSFASEVPQSNKVASSLTPYRMGALALTSSRRAVIYLNCSSTKFESNGSRQSFAIRGETNNRYEPDGSPAEAGRNNLIVMHSGALALARALGCKNNAGLPDKFVMPSRA